MFTAWPTPTRRSLTLRGSCENRRGVDSLRAYSQSWCACFMPHNWIQESAWLFAILIVFGARSFLDSGIIKLINSKMIRAAGSNRYSKALGVSAAIIFAELILLGGALLFLGHPIGGGTIGLPLLFAVS